MRWDHIMCLGRRRVKNKHTRARARASISHELWFLRCRRNEMIVFRLMTATTVNLIINIYILYYYVVYTRAMSNLRALKVNI